MIALRQATPDDIPLLWALRTRAVAHSCAGHYAPDVLAAAVDGSAILGYAVLALLTDEVDAAFVDPAQHGRGIGRVLLAALEADARAAGIGRLFLSASLNAVPFYERAGFAAVREELHPHRSGIGIPSVFMEKVLG
ncbi:MAG: putative acetyltransferase [Massilia sp.]|jgi:GNAT superfamily N-acetyltransferase